MKTRCPIVFFVFKLIFSTAVFLLIFACNLTKKPVINSFTVTNITPITADFNFEAAEFETLTLAIDFGKAIPVTGNSYHASGLKSNSEHTATLTAYNETKTTAKTITFTTGKFNLSISSFLVSSITPTSATFTFSATGDAPIASQTLVNTKSGQTFDVTGKQSFVVNNLASNTDYTFMLTVKDFFGNEETATKSFKTLQNQSAWMSEPQVSYGAQFAIIGNAVSNELTVTINNTSGVAKTFASLTANFGANGSAVKMLRYSQNGGAWNVLQATNGAITFSNITLKPGANTFACYFALKATVGVANGSPLTFAFTSLNDGDGAEVPASGKFADAMPVGTVNANTQPTIITSDWWGYMSQTSTTLPPGFVMTNPSSMYNVDIRSASGPAGARWGSVKLRNPYGNQIYFDNTDWRFSNFIDAVSQIPQSNVSWNGDYVNLTMTPAAKVNTDGTYTSFIIFAKVGNSSSTQEFKSTNTTPGLFGFQLMSKYDIVLLNSDNQAVDLSDVVVKQGSSILSN